MLKRLSSREILEQVAVDWEPAVRRSWMESLDEIRSNIVLKRVVERLERGDVHGAVQQMGIEDAKFARVEIALRQAYDAGGISTVSNMPNLRDPSGNRVVFSWGVRNLSGESELRRHAADLVTGITDDARHGLREVLTESLARGQSPYKAGLDAVGRISRVTGRREGGLIGLTSQQMRTAAWIRQALRDGNAEGMRQYLGLKLRDRRFDRAVLKALRDGVGLPDGMTDRIVGQYSNRALDYRGKVIARHETMAALDKSRYDALRQQIEAGKLDARDVTKRWRHSAQEHPRLQHVAMNGQAVPFDQPFVAPDGTRLRYPRDHDAPASHTINCKCRPEYTIDFTRQALRRYRERVGG